MARDPLTVARARRAALAAEHARAVAAATKAHSALDVAAKVFREAEAALAAARDRYADEPTAKAGNAVRRARDAAELAELATTRPRRACQDADQAAEVAARALTECDLEIRTIERDRELERLRRVASPDGYHDRTAAHYQRLFALLTECEQVVGEIDAEYQASAAAAVEAGVEPLGGHHWLVPLVEHAAAEQPGALHFLDQPSGVVESSPAFALGRYATDPRPSAVTVHRVLAAIRSSARSATGLHPLLPVDDGWLAVARARLEVLAATPQTPEAVRAAMAVTPAAALEVVPEPPSIFARALAAVTGAAAAE